MLAAFAGPAPAHVVAGYNLRVVHVVPAEGGYAVFYRLSLPLVFGLLLGPERQDGTVAPLPFTWNETVGGTRLHRIDIEAVRADPAGLAAFVTGGHVLRADGTPLAPELRGVRLQPRGSVPPFDTAAEAAAATSGPVFPEGGPEVDLFSAVLDVAAFYPAAGPVGRLSIESRLHPGRLGGHETINLVIYHPPGEAPVRRQFSGLMAEPVPVHESLWRTVAATVWLGIEHIAGGLDHVVFVLCLTVGAGRLRVLVARVTAFTFGHSVTLTLGALGQVPAAPWFVPAVETAIAASIVWVALAAGRSGGTGGPATLLVVAGLGLVHGFGFSFLLRDILGTTPAHLLAQLAAFNLGVELGQLAIVIAAAAVLARLGRHDPARRARATASVRTGAAWVGAVWIAERLPGLLAAIGA
jgi:hypothetical protein